MKHRIDHLDTELNKSEIRSPLPSRDCVVIRHPGQVRRTRAGIQK